MIDENLFGEVIIRKDDEVWDQSYRTQPQFLVFADEQFSIMKSRDGKFYIGSNITKDYNFMPYKDLLKHAKPVFKRYAIIMDVDYSTLGHGGPDRSYTYCPKAGRNEQIDVLYELSSGVYAVKIWNEYQQSYEFNGKITLIEKHLLKNHLRTPQFIKEVNKNVSLSDVYESITKFYVGNDEISEEQVINELKNLLINELKQEHNESEKERRELTSKFNELKKESDTRYNVLNQEDQEWKSKFNEDKQKCISKAIKFYNEKLKNKNSIEEKVL